MLSVCMQNLRTSGNLAYDFVVASRVTGGALPALLLVAAVQAAKRSGSVAYPSRIKQFNNNQYSYLYLIRKLPQTATIIATSVDLAMLLKSIEAISPITQLVNLHFF